LDRNDGTALLMVGISFLLVAGSSVLASNVLTVATGSRSNDAIWACVNPIDFRSSRKASSCIVSDLTTRITLLAVPGGTQREKTRRVGHERAA
jgi:hypothetical protein